MSTNMNSGELNGQKSGDVEPKSVDQTFYDKTALYGISEVAHALWMREIEHYFNGYSQRLNLALADSAGYVAELGAGSCGLSVCLNRLSNVQHINALDISKARMEKMMKLSAKVLEGGADKISTIACDFNGRLPFSDGELDAVLFDASLHHARSMWGILAECNRVLKKGGVLVAQRESYLNPLRAKKQLDNLLKTPEVAASVSENMYLKEQYCYYLRVAGFRVDFIPRSINLAKRILVPLNGVLFSDGVLYCTKY